ncbi:MULTISPECIES: methyltransferase domain-containing protein [unclassified Ensifer]|uniref:methyltransferase domain-containing protein n=1 Tax=unclassified Ensifer TaxID=2633371 RepID=UPI00300F8BEB
MPSEVPAMPFTGERFVPEEEGNIAIEHIHRYLAASRLARGKTVLDIACGEGYGSALLAGVADRVFGVDVAADAVHHAKAKYQQENLEFLCGDCSAIPVDDQSIDLVVSFETLEHHDKHDAFFAEIKRVLRTNGSLLMSSPDKKYYSEERDFHNTFHVKELYESEFHTLVSRYFANSAFFSQRIVFGSAIFPILQACHTRSFSYEKGNVRESSGLLRPYYNIALASDGRLPEFDGVLLEQPINDSEVIHSWEKVMSERNLELDHLRAQCREYERLVNAERPTTDLTFRDAATPRFNDRKTRVLFTLGVTLTDNPYGEYLKFQAYHLVTFKNLASLFEGHGIECKIVVHPTLIEFSKRTHEEMGGLISLERFQGQSHFNEFLDVFDPEFHIVWNGHVERQLVKISRSRGVQVAFCELGWLPQKETFFIDFNGVNAQSSLAHLPLLDRVVSNTFDRWRKSFLEERVVEPVNVENFVFVPLQMENDENIISYSPFKTMAEFVSYVRDAVGGTLVVRPHPGQPDVSLPDLPDVIVRRDGTIDSWISASNYVVGINSTSLIEALLYEKVVYACGNHFFPAHYGATLYFTPNDNTVFPPNTGKLTIAPARRDISDKVISYLVEDFQLPRSCQISPAGLRRNAVLSKILRQST